MLSQDELRLRKIETTEKTVETGRFLIFSCFTYYPAGGPRDLVGSAKTEDEAEEQCLKGLEKWSYSSWFDTETGRWKEYDGEED